MRSGARPAEIYSGITLDDDSPRTGQLERIGHSRAVAEPKLRTYNAASDMTASNLVLPGSLPVIKNEVIRAQEREYSRARAGRITGGVIDWIGSVAALILIISAVLTVGGANPDNGITRITGTIAPYLATGFTDLFRPGDPNFALVLNYGSAAVFWVLAGSMVARLIRKVTL